MLSISSARKPMRIFASEPRVKRKATGRSSRRTQETGSSPRAPAWDAPTRAGSAASSSSIESLRRRSEVPTGVCDIHSPWSNPPLDVAVSARFPPTLISIPLLYRRYEPSPPRCKALTTLTVDPNRAKDLRLRDEPKCKKSSTDIENTDPNRVSPLTDIELPARAKLRSDSELPKCKKSSTDIENTDPNRVSPLTDTELPARAKL